MGQSTTANAVNAIYYLYFENRELVHYFEIVWSEDGMSSHDEEECYIFCGMGLPCFPVDLQIFSFLLENTIIEKTGGSEHECTYELTDYYRTGLTTRLKGNGKEYKAVAQ
jgi:hypothetical protein